MSPPESLVSSHFGGVQMDALFVDEGFGTLDRKSIESAMDILLDLSETSKLVGIISHREELVENIPQQIRVNSRRRVFAIICQNAAHDILQTGPDHRLRPAGKKR